MAIQGLNLVKLGKNLKQARELLGLNQSDVASYLGVDQSMVSKYENGERAISAGALDKLSALLCFSVQELINSDNINPKRNIAFRTEGITFKDNCILANVNKIILNQFEMEELLNEKN